MPEVMQIINIILPVFLVIGLGYALGAKGLISAESNSKFTWFVFYVSAPALLFRGAASTPLSRAVDLRSLAAVYAVSILSAAVVYAAGMGTSPGRRGVFAQGVFRTNLVFVGLPVIMNAFGAGVLGPASVLIGFTVPIYNLLAVLFLTLPHHEGAERPGVWIKTLRGVALNPLVLASAAGLVCSGLDLRLPASMDRSLQLVGRIAMPLALITVGAGLDFSKLRDEIGAAMAVAFIKLLIYPALIFMVLRLLGSSGVNLRLTVLLMAAPTAVMSHVMASEMKGDPRLSGSIVIATTLMSFFTIAAWLAFFEWLW